MNPEPETSKPVPEIPRGRLWLALLTPPLLMGVGNLVAGLSKFLPLYLVTPIVAFFGIIWGAIHFNELMRFRHLGGFRDLIVFFYLIGQIVICLALWYGSCFLFVP
ncbi:MAG: hypothetical protein CFE26_18245 [Verrucomicrobiales bacterium VVV1]|nr:MAG: hypothetical protein CFE26_18245 [Verrucomicrobiales bacterium VVV1]